MGVNSLTGVAAQGRAVTGDRTRDHSIASPAPYTIVRCATTLLRFTVTVTVCISVEEETLQHIVGRGKCPGGACPTLSTAGRASASQLTTTIHIDIGRGDDLGCRPDLSV